MNLFIKTRTFVFHAALIALYALPAIAVAAVPSAADLLHYRSGKGHKPELVTMTLNDGLQRHDGQMAEHNLKVDPVEGSIRDTAGATVRVGSHVNGAKVEAIAEAPVLSDRLIR